MPLSSAFGGTVRGLRGEGMRPEASNAVFQCNLRLLRLCWEEERLLMPLPSAIGGSKGLRAGLFCEGMNEASNAVFLWNWWS